MPSKLDHEVRRFGCPKLVLLDRNARPEQIQYLDLLPGRRRPRSSAEAPVRLPDAVAEFQGRPLLYILDKTEDGLLEDQTDDIPALQHLLANRSDQACLAVVRPGEMVVYPIHLDSKRLRKTKPDIIKVSDPDAPLFFQSIATGSRSIKGSPESSDHVYQAIHDLLKGASDELSGLLQPLDVLAVCGRALFFRFLIDRGIVRATDLDRICPAVTGEDLKDVFSNAQKAAATSAWLDDTFNGNLLPLLKGLSPDLSFRERVRRYHSWYLTAGRVTNLRIFAHLEAILRGWEHVGGSTFQITIDWNELDFAHIPIGVLSQVYETFSHTWDVEPALQRSVHYTPRNIARILVEESIAGSNNPASARVLDPACGAGVFLVLALRELVRRRWKADGERPNKTVIHQILYEQLCGFDVSEPALRLAALALYITAIELNAITRPPRLHKALQPLQGIVLHNWGSSADAISRAGFVLGSLGADVPKTFDGMFDVVLGNPPWTRLRPFGKTQAERRLEAERIERLNKRFTEIGRRVLAGRDLPEQDTYDNPDNVPDLAFVFRAAEWAKPNAVISYALDARLILKQDGPGRKARNAIFRAFAVSGILNGFDLEKTAVWPGMDMPFLLFFARNETPTPDHSFYFVTPIREEELSAKGVFRLDYTSAQAVANEDVLTKPWLLKTLGVGTTFDVEVVEKIESVTKRRAHAVTGEAATEAVEQKEALGEDRKPWAQSRMNHRLLPLADFWIGAHLAHGAGYHQGNKIPVDRTCHLYDLDEFAPPSSGFAINFGALQKWRHVNRLLRVEAARTKEVYQPPLVIVPQTPGETREQPKAYISRTDPLAYSQSYYGYSTAGYKKPQLIANMLYLIAHSLVWQHHFLTHSSRIGASFRTFIKEDLDTFPFPNPDLISTNDEREITKLAAALELSTSPDFNDIDDLVFRLYGLNDDDASIVRDTVKYRSPYRSTRVPAASHITPSEVDKFCAELRDSLQPFFSVASQCVVVEPIEAPANGLPPPWRFLTLTTTQPIGPAYLEFVPRLMRTASESAASRVIVKVPNGGLLMGLSNQARFWTKTRARLCALHIAREHLDHFPLPKE